jgi:hypothetical protein
MDHPCFLKPTVDADWRYAVLGWMKKYLPLIALLACAGCSNACQNTVASRALSPDGIHSAILFQRDCGATTGFSTQISVLGNGGAPSGSGNAYQADDNHGVAAVGDWQGPWANMRWLGTDRLLIRYATKSRIFAQESEVDGVKIDYQQVDR